jgi:pimeloyl-ACP methyl ester carboxylesterase
MAKVSANGIEIEYESFGSSDEVLVLVMGLGAQMILWDREFCEQLASHGLRVIRFDNRDVGLSTHFESAGVPNVVQMMGELAEGKLPESPYSLDDMADDTAGLIDGLGIGPAHVCGASMGGMIAQTVAFRHPDKVKSLTSVMSTTGDPKLPQGKPEVMALLAKAPPADRAGYIDYAVEMWSTVGSPGFAFDEAATRERSGRHYDRNFDPGGVGRQLAAVFSHGDRTERLAGVRAPTLVIHGADDPLVPVEAGRATQAAIAGAELLEIAGMGHDFSRGTWPQMVEAVAGHALRNA